MIAASSLFTSCIEQVEPEGVKAIREAKARYYDALSQLRAKDGELRQAEAAAHPEQIEHLERSAFDAVLDLVEVMHIANGV